MVAGHRFPLDDAASAAAAASSRYAVAFEHGTLELGMYAPAGSDPQQPHDRDELYLVMQGTGHFRNGDVVEPFGPGDVLFVPSGVEHRFEGFTDDIQVWVVFYGPPGGEG